MIDAWVCWCSVNVNIACDHWEVRINYDWMHARKIHQTYQINEEHNFNLCVSSALTDSWNTDNPHCISRVSKNAQYSLLSSIFFRNADTHLINLMSREIYKCVLPWQGDSGNIFRNSDRLSGLSCHWQWQVLHWLGFLCDILSWAISTVYLFNTKHKRGLLSCMQTFF